MCLTHLSGFLHTRAPWRPELDVRTWGSYILIIFLFSDPIGSTMYVCRGKDNISHLL